MRPAEDGEGQLGRLQFGDVGGNYYFFVEIGFYFCPL